MAQYVIVHGNVSTGIEEIIGPFENAREAGRWALENLGNSPYHPMLPLTPPEKEVDE